MCSGRSDWSASIIPRSTYWSEVKSRSQCASAAMPFACGLYSLPDTLFASVSVTCVPSVSHVDELGSIGRSSSPNRKTSPERAASTEICRGQIPTRSSPAFRSSAGTACAMTTISAALCSQRDAVRVCTHTGSGAASVWTRCMLNDIGVKSSRLCGRPSSWTSV